MTMPCDLGKLSALIDGELAAGERDAVEAHVAACPHCSGILTEFRQNDETVRGVMTPNEYPAGVDRMEAEVLRRIGERRRISILRPALMSAAAVLVVSALALVLWRAREERIAPIDNPKIEADEPRMSSSSISHAAAPGPVVVEEKNSAFASDADLADVVSGGEAIMLNFVNGADAEDLPLIQTAIVSNGYQSRLSASKSAAVVDEPTKRRLTQMEAVLIGLNNVEEADAAEHLVMIQGVINEQGLINALQETKRRSEHGKE